MGGRREGGMGYMGAWFKRHVRDKPCGENPVHLNPKTRLSLEHQQAATATIMK